MTTKELTYRIAFSQVRGINRVTAEQLLARVGSEEAFFKATDNQLRCLLTSEKRFIAQSYRNELLAKASQEIDFITRHDVKPLYFTDNNYPSRLKECDDAPLMLYTMGNCDLNSAHIVGIVGTRHSTPYGIDYTNRIVEGLSKMLDNTIIISGLAYGIDITAHRAALKNNIPTAAVLAHGLNTIYPAQHRNTAIEMLNNGGALITDYISTDAVHRGNFLARNRIVAGLCDCLLVVESAEKGGALVTAHVASSYNRDVFALPGRANDPYSAGCNRIISSGLAALVQSPDDIINAMRWTAKAIEGDQCEMFTELSEEEQQIHEYLLSHPQSNVNQLSVGINMPLSRLMPTLIDMEFQGIIINLPGGRYEIVNPGN